ncbi:DUF2889 domain-containing protein [Paucibacter sp. APW11]|uniref:DUF2889 domain-containing protein n=1 Tax=Roseateles aquae TaxID=3077235 RepID=A0ABU3PEM3_9BURK|nr:DUF2889 domain-containing protein [Paucibacter sp. APW11]MDT9001014.1 DUF2889 domain-containing protein [Paucibacter sp. APW11]
MFSEGTGGFFAPLHRWPMSVFPPCNERRLLHRRAIDVQVFARQDGAFDVEASLADTKTRDLPLATGLRRAGEPIHQMGLHLVVDAQLNILSASSRTDWSPYPGFCDQHGNAYAALVGLNLMKGFRQSIKQRLAGSQACTHLTELCQVLPTAVIQAFAGLVLDTREGSDSDVPPYQLDRCHALRSDGPVVQTHYPRWYRGVTDSPSADLTRNPS